MKNKTPVLFLAYANAYQAAGYLRNLPLEVRETRKVLAVPIYEKAIEVVIRENVTLQDIVEVFSAKEYRGRITVFHFSGHANEFSLLLQNSQQEQRTISGEGFADFLAKEPALRLVFLNACATRQQGEWLVGKGIPLAISTLEEVRDDVAKDLAVEFYRKLGTGASVDDALATAVSLTKALMERNESYRELYRPATNTETKKPPWHIQYNAEFPKAGDWFINVEGELPLYGLQRVVKGIPPQEPLPGLAAYVNERAPFFWGRDQAIRKGYDMITDAHDNTRVYLFYGESGVGLSSYLKAGLIPYLSSDFEVTELDFSSDDLPLKLESIRRTSEKPVLLVLDHSNQVTLNDLWPSLHAKLIKGEIDRIILGTSSRHIQEVEMYLKEEQMIKRFYLRPLGFEEIQEILQKLSAEKKSYQIKITPELRERLAFILSKEDSSGVATLLQFLLITFWEKTRKMESVDWPFYQKLEKEGLWKKFLQQRLAIVSENLQISKGLLLNILEVCLLAKEGGGSLDSQALVSKFYLTPGKANSFLREMRRQRLLSENYNSRGDSSSYKLTHELLVLPLHQLIKYSNEPAQQVRRRLAYHLENDDKYELLTALTLQQVNEQRKDLPRFSDKEEILLEISAREIARERRKKRIKLTLSIITILVILVFGFLFTNPFFLLYILLLILAYQSRRIFDVYSDYFSPIKTKDDQ